MGIKRKQKFKHTDISIADRYTPNGIFHAAGFTRKTLRGEHRSIKRFYKNNKLMIELRTVAQAWHYIENNLQEYME